MKIAFMQVGPGIGPITNNNFRFAKVLSERGYSIDLVGTNINQDVYDTAPPCINLYSLQVHGFIKYILPLAKYLKDKNPDAIFCSGPTTHVASGIAKLISNYKGAVVYRSHIETSIYLEERSWINRKVLTLLLRLTKNLCHKNVAASRGAANDLAEVLRIDPSRVDVLYNPCVDDAVLISANESVNHPWLLDRKYPVLVTAARLAEQKSIDVMLRALALSHEHKKMRLIILGDGPLKDELIELTRELKIHEYVDFHGHVDNPYAFMKQADLFVLSSNFEGFANVVAEALAVGCPVVSTNAPSGPAEILAGGRYGKLVPVGDYKKLSNAMIEATKENVDKGYLIERGMQFHASKLTTDLLYLLD